MGPEATLDNMPFWNKESGAGARDFKRKQAIHR